VLVMSTRSARSYLQDSVKPLKELVKYCQSTAIYYKLSEPLSQYSSIRIGGKADLLVFPTVSHCTEIFKLLKDLNIPYIVIGGGSNTLFPDEGLRGVVVSTEALNSCHVIGDKGLLETGAGVSLWRLIRLATESGLSGLEPLAGIPGTIGGAVCGNAGAFGVEIKDLLSHIEVLRPSGVVERLNREAIRFAYRQAHLGDGVILRAVLRLLPEDREKIRQKVKFYLKEKRSRQPVDRPSLGCVFKNPEGYSAGRLIDEAGCKGMRQGGIVVSNLHANFFVNEGRGTAKDYLELLSRVRERVYLAFGLWLEAEIRHVNQFCHNLKV